MGLSGTLPPLVLALRWIPNQQLLSQLETLFGVQVCPKRQLLGEHNFIESLGRNQLGRTYSPGLPLSMFEREEIVKLFQVVQGWSKGHVMFRTAGRSATSPNVSVWLTVVSARYSTGSFHSSYSRERFKRKTWVQPLVSKCKEIPLPRLLLWWESCSLDAAVTQLRHKPPTD